MRILNIRKRSQEKGSILVVATFVIVALLIIAIPFLFKLSAQWRSTERSSHALASLGLAEAGIDKVMWYLDPLSSQAGSDPEEIQWDNTGANQVGFINDVKAPDNSVIGDVQVELTPPNGATPERRFLDSTGLVPFLADNTVNRTVRLTLEKDQKSIFDFGFFVDEFFYIHNAFEMDTYDSSKGDYGETLADGTVNWRLPAYFGTNSYIPGDNPNDPGEASWVIDAGGGSSDIYGSIAAGGDAAEDYNNGTAPDPPDPDLLDEVVNVPDGTLDDDGRFVMKQEYELPSVDVFNLPPKEILGSVPLISNWFEDDPTNPGTALYYPARLERVPFSDEIVNTYEHSAGFNVASGGTGSLTPSDNGFYPTFIVGDDKSGGTVNVSDGDVVIYVTELAENPRSVGRFFLGKGSTINIAPDSSLTVILGNTSFVVDNGYTINQTSGTPADLVILGTDQFAFPITQDENNLPKKMSQLDDIPGLMYFEHGQSDGTIYAAIYAPRAHVATGQGQNHMNMFGAFITKSMDFKNQVDFHYDKALSDRMIVVGGFDYWKIINWQEVVPPKTF